MTNRSGNIFQSSSNSATTNLYFRKLELFTASIPLVLFFLYFWKFAVNAPWFDDVEAFPAFLIDFSKESSISQKLTLLLKPNNEHRILFAKLVTVVQYWFTGAIDYRWLMLIGNLSVVGIFLLIVRVFNRNQLSGWHLVPLSLLLFQPHYHLVSFWAITSLQHQPTAFLVLLSLYCLVKKSWQYFMGSVVLILLATFSMSNGMFGWLAGAVLLFVQSRYKSLLLWAMLMVLAVFLYFWGFSTQGNEAGFTYLRAYPHKIVLAFFTFIGGFLDLLPSQYEPFRFALPIIFGVFMTLGLGTLAWQSLVPRKSNSLTTTWQRLTADELFVVGGLIYLLINALVVSVLRPRFGFGVLVVSNYKLYPTLLISLFYTWWMLRQHATKQKPSQKQLVAFILVTLLANGLAYWRFTPEVENRHRNLLANCFNQRYNQVGLGGMVGTPLANYINKVLTQSINAKHYQYPQAFYTPYQAELRLPATNQKVFPNVSVIDTPAHFAIYNPDFQQDNLSSSTFYWVLQSVQHTYLIATQAAPYEGRNPFKRGRGVVAFVQKPLLYSGDYQIGMLGVMGKQHELKWTNKTLHKP